MSETNETAQLGTDMEKLTGVELIAQERKEQVEKHGFSAEHDARQYNSKGELVQAACYLLCKDSLLIKAHPSNLRYALFPSSWNGEYKIKFDQKEDLQSLIIAGALIAAEIDRIQAAK